MARAAKKEIATTELETRGIAVSTWNTLKNSIYPGAADDSILMVLDYCKARGFDPIQKPVHIVPMSVKEGNEYVMRDVVMPGINTYRIQAARSGDMGGSRATAFGPDISAQLGSMQITYPEWVEWTVEKTMPDGSKVNYTSREYFLENYATKKRNDETPNAMWAKRPMGQLKKCAEAQALRMGWPEIGQQPTFEEMEGKTEIDITPTAPKKKSIAQQVMSNEIPDHVFDRIMGTIATAESAVAVNEIYAGALKEIEQYNDGNQAAEHFKEAAKNRIAHFDSA